MERGTYDRIRRTLRRLGRRRQSGRQRYTDAGILEVYLWAAGNDKPVRWACDPVNWPPGVRRGPLPSESAVSRRMHTERMAALIERVRCSLQGEDDSLVAAMDGKPLVIGPHSHDAQSGYGRAASGKARGYKLHVIVSIAGRVLSWRIAPMHIDERAMARRMLRDLERTGYLLADANYDSNKLFDLAIERGVQLITPRRYGPGRGLGRRPQSPARLRSKDLMETDTTGFREDLMRQRWSVERFFGTLSSRPGGLGHLPAWVRSWRRVRNWVAAKLLIDAAYRCRKREAMVQ